MCERCADREEREALFGKTFVTCECRDIRDCKDTSEGPWNGHTKVAFRKENTEIDALYTIREGRPWLQI